MHIDKKDCSLTKEEIRELEDEQNIRALKKQIEQLKGSIKLKKYLERLYQLYKKYIYKNPNIKVNYKLAQKLFFKANTNIRKIQILTNIFPRIDFINDKKYINEIKSLERNYLTTYPHKLALLLAIQEFINSHFKYPFFLGLFFLQTKKKDLLKETMITNEDITFLTQVINTDKDFNQSDKYLIKLRKILESKNNKKIKEFIIQNFSKLEKTNQELLLKYFGNTKSNKDGVFLYSYLADTTINNIIEKYKVAYCIHVTLIAKHFFNKLYTGHDAKLLTITNLLLKHAYNLLVIKTKNKKTKLIYIDFLWDKKKIVEDHWYHDIDFLVK